MVYVPPLAVSLGTEMSLTNCKRKLFLYIFGDYVYSIYEEFDDERHWTQVSCKHY